MTSNERGSRPSASGMTRVFNCPASFKMNLLETPEGSAAADEGTRLHKLCEIVIKDKLSFGESKACQELIRGLSDEQLFAADFATATAKRIIKKTEELKELHTERRLWAKSGLFSGQADLSIVEPQKKHATIIDYKFGRGEVESAERNYQLSALAVLAFENYQIESATVMIIQPRALDKSRTITECEYSREDIEAAREAINAACKEAIESENPAQKCGYWCKYCPSAYRCKAAQDALNVQFKLATASPNLAIGKHNALDMYNKAVLVKNFCEAVLEKIKTFIANNPDADCGLELTKGAKRSKLGDAAKVFDAVCGAGIAPEEFVNVCKVESGKLLSLYYNKRKLANEKLTKKASDAELKSRLESEGLLTYTEAAPTLKLCGGEK